jgi:phospholipid/cholesterol/gamma-HCH transport system substrate-binding protein
MQKYLTTTIKVGGLVILITVAGYYIYDWVSKAKLPEKGYDVWALFEDASGLVKRSRVEIAGINVGTIKDISLKNGMAKVTIRIKPGIVLYSNATIAKRLISVLGEYFIVITPGTKDKKPLKHGDQIKTVVEAKGIDKLLQSLSRISSDVRKVTQTAAQIFGTEEGAQRIDEIMKDLTEIAKGVNRSIEQNSRLITRTLRKVDRLAETAVPDIQKVISNFRQITSEVRRIVGRGEAQVDETVGTIQGTLRTLNTAIKKLDKTLSHIEKVSERLNKGEGTAGRLLKDETLIDGVEEVVEGAGEFVSSITRLQTIVGLRSEYNLEANTLKTYMELRLQPKEDKYYLIEIIDDPRGKTTTTQLVIESSDPEKPLVYREERIETTEAFRFSFQFAKILPPATFRFGIKESTGGIGMDLNLIEDRLEIRLDLFNFGANAWPRLKALASLEFFKRLYILAGIDNVFNENTRDYYIGAQLRFNDKDLKSLLTVGSIPSLK